MRDPSNVRFGNLDMFSIPRKLPELDAAKRARGRAPRLFQIKVGPQMTKNFNICHFVVPQKRFYNQRVMGYFNNFCMLNLCFFMSMGKWHP